MVGIRQALLITRGPPPYRGLYQSARWRASRERGELEGEEPSHTATTTRSRHKFSLPTHPRLAQRVVCVLPPSLVIVLWFRVPLVERFVHPRLNGSFNSSTERLVGGKLLKQFSIEKIRFMTKSVQQVLYI